MGRAYCQVGISTAECNSSSSPCWSSTRKFVPIESSPPPLSSLRRPSLHESLSCNHILQAIVYPGSSFGGTCVIMSPISFFSSSRLLINWPKNPSIVAVALHHVFTSHHSGVAWQSLVIDAGHCWGKSVCLCLTYQKELKRRRS